MRLLLLAVLIVPAFAQDDIKDYYSHTSAPRVTLTTEGNIDVNTYKEIDIPAVLAILKFELAKGSWRDLSRDDRDKFIAMLDDPGLKFIYTRAQSTWPDSVGGQTIDKNTVKISQDGLFIASEHRPYLDLAKLFLHEMGHVYQERFNWLPRPLTTKETFPVSLEKQLPAANFNPATVAMVRELIKCPDVSGTWKGTLKITNVPEGSSVKKDTTRPGVLGIDQTGCELTLKFGNNVIKGTIEHDDAKFNREATGTVTSVTLKFTNPGSTNATVEVVELKQKGPGGDVVSASEGSFKSH